MTITDKEWELDRKLERIREKLSEGIRKAQKEILKLDGEYLCINK